MSTKARKRKHPTAKPSHGCDEHGYDCPGGAKPLQVVQPTWGEILMSMLLAICILAFAYILAGRLPKVPPKGPPHMTWYATPIPGQHFPKN